VRPFAILLLVLWAAVGVRAEESGQLAGQELIAALQKGGYTIFLRHPKTHADQADTDPLNLENIQAQRHLSEEGRQQAKALGEALRTLQIPVDRVIASKFYRAYEAAKLLNVAEVTTSIDISEGGLVVSPQENRRRAQALRQLLATPPPAGKNTLIVSHRPNLQDAAGKEFGDVGKEKPPSSSRSARTISHWSRAWFRRNGFSGPNDRGRWDMSQRLLRSQSVPCAHLRGKVEAAGGLR
jgi:phosphohistidine phosphatase SixA